MAPGLKVLLASSEVHPFSKTGGLGDMIGALAKALAELGAQVTLVTPLYRGIRRHHPEDLVPDRQFELPLGSGLVEARLFRLRWRPGLDVVFVDQPDYYDRAEIYQEHGEGYPDNAARFIFFCKCVVEVCRGLAAPPDLVHAHDWPSALVPLLLLDQGRREGWGSTPATCLTIHNLAYQGVFDRSAYHLTNLPWDYWMPGVEFYGAMNCLKAGIHHAHALTTVSPRYAREILTESLGMGLDGELRRREADLVGILNGADYEEWRTEGNPALPHSYNARDLSGKARTKAALQRELNLPEEPDVPLFANISRLVDHKGSDLLLGALEEMVAARMQFVQLGSGPQNLERAFLGLARRHPRHIAVRIGHDEGLAHRIEAGCDFYVMPSRFEPCGLNQMYSLRYGAIPIVRATGGLDDSVVDPLEDPEAANGIKFHEASARVLAHAMRKALALYASPRALSAFRRRGMAVDFSWNRTAAAYLEVYEQARRRKGG